MWMRVPTSTSNRGLKFYLFRALSSNPKSDRGKGIRLWNSVKKKGKKTRGKETTCPLPYSNVGGTLQRAAQAENPARVEERIEGAPRAVPPNHLTRGGKVHTRVRISFGTGGQPQQCGRKGNPTFNKGQVVSFNISDRQTGVPYLVPVTQRRDRQYTLNRNETCNEFSVPMCVRKTETNGFSVGLQGAIPTTLNGSTFQLQGGPWPWEQLLLHCNAAD